MSNAQLAWNNAVVDGATFTNYTASAADDGEAANMATASLSKRWVSYGLTGADAAFDVTLTGAPTVAMIALCSHNLTLAATVRVRGYSAAYAATVYDSGTISAWAASVTAASTVGMRWNFIHKLSTPTAAVIWRVEISDGANPAGTIYVGRLFAGKSVWQPTINMLAGAGLGWESNSEIAKALNGAEWFVDAEGHRVAKFNLANMPQAEMLANAFDLQRCAAGTQREVMFQYDPADTEHSVRRSLFGRLRQLTALEEPYAGTLKTAFEVKELL